MYTQAFLAIIRKILLQKMMEDNKDMICTYEKIPNSVDYHESSNHTIRDIEKCKSSNVETNLLPSLSDLPLELSLSLSLDQIAEINHIRAQDVEAWETAMRDEELALYNAKAEKIRQERWVHCSILLFYLSCFAIAFITKQFIHYSDNFADVCRREALLEFSELAVVMFLLKIPEIVLRLYTLSEGKLYNQLVGDLRWWDLILTATVILWMFAFIPRFLFTQACQKMLN